MSTHGFMREEEYAGGKFDWSLWRRIMRHARPHWRWLRIMLVSGVLLALIETLLPLSNAWIIDEAVRGNVGAAFWWLAGT